jgi:hypothetical protein
MKTNRVIALMSLLATSNTVWGVLYNQDFNVDDTANWTVNASGGDTTANFFYDYSGIGVPAAPNGTGTRGLKMTCNNVGNTFNGLSVSPNGQSFAGNYTVSFDMWQNYAGPLGPGGNGTTQLSLYGIGATGSTASWIGGWTAGGAQGLGFGTTLDGGSASDYRAYSSAALTSYASGNAVYQAPAGGINNSNAYYAVYTAQPAPAAQVGLFPGQTGSTDPGETAFKWRRVTIDVSGGFANWSIDGLALAKVDLSTVTLGGSNIFFGHDDTNATSSTDPNAALLNVTLIDNIQVTPEPGTVGLLLLGVPLLARRRKAFA